MPQTVATTRIFDKDAKKVLSADELASLINVIAAEPMAGTLISGTGGFRKIRFGRDGTGKRGGIRVMYWYFDNDTPIYLFALFAKNEKDNLNQVERNALADQADVLKTLARRRKERS